MYEKSALKKTIFVFGDSRQEVLVKPILLFMINDLDLTYNAYII